jgi:hypothetical protein
LRIDRLEEKKTSSLINKFFEKTTTTTTTTNKQKTGKTRKDKSSTGVANCVSTD